MLEIKNYKNGDEVQIINLFKDAFCKNLSIDLWKWTYNSNLFNQKYIKLMWDKNILAGHYAVIPIKLYEDGKDLLSGLSMTTMTSSLYKKRGIFRELALNLYFETYNKINLVWGFPNDNSIHGFVKYLGWKHVGDIYIYRCKSKKYTIKEDNIKEVEFFDKKVNDLFEIVKNTYKIISNRNAEYLNWRYKEHAENTYSYIVYEINKSYLGYCIYKIYEDNNEKYCDIVDIISVNQEVFKSLLEYLNNKMNNIGVQYLNMWMNDKENLNIAKNIGFYKTDLGTHFGIKINCDSLKEDIYKFSDWYITMGDSDVY